MVLVVGDEDRLTRRLEGAVVYTVVAGASAVSAIASVGGSLRILDLSGSPAVMSVGVLVYNIMFTLTSLLWEYLLGERLGSRGLLLYSLLLLMSGVALMAFSPLVVLVVVGTGLVGASLAILSPVAITVLTEYLRRDSVAAVNYNICSSIGSVAGYVAAVFMSHAVSRNVLGLTIPFIIVLAVLSVMAPSMRIVVEHRRLSFLSIIPHSTGHLRPFPTALFSPRIIHDVERLMRAFRKMVYRSIHRRMPLTLLGSLVLFASIALFFTPMPAFLREIGFSDPHVYSLYALLAVVATVSYRFVEKAMPGAEKAWRILIVSCAARILLFPTPAVLLHLSPELAGPVTIIVFSLLGVTWAGISASLLTVMLGMSERERRGERIGHLNMMTGLGVILGSLASTVIVERAGYTGTCTVATLLIALATIVFYKAWRAIAT